MTPRSAARIATLFLTRDTSTATFSSWILSLPPDLGHRLLLDPGCRRSDAFLLSCPPRIKHGSVSRFPAPIRSIVVELSKYRRRFRNDERDDQAWFCGNGVSGRGDSFNRRWNSGAGPGKERRHSRERCRLRKRRRHGSE